MAFLDYVWFGVLGLVDNQIVELFDNVMLYEIIL